MPANRSLRFLRTRPDVSAQTGSAALVGGVCLALLALAGAFGLKPDVNGEPIQDARAGNAQIKSVAIQSAADVHRQKVFDTRRETFSGHASGPPLAHR